MIYLDSESLELLNKEELKAEALRYSNLCKIQADLIQIQEAQLKKMAEELGSRHQLVLFAQQQLDQLKNRVYGKSSERRAGIGGLPLFDSAQAKEQQEEAAPSDGKRKKKKEEKNTVW